MRPIIVATLLLLALTVTIYKLSANAKKESDTSFIKPVVQANNDFAITLYQQLSKENEGKNIFFSPYSISSAFAITWEGAKGNTANEMASTLKFSDYVKTNSAVHAGLGALNLKYNQPNKPYQLAVANALWGEKTFPFLDSYLEALAKPYGTVLFPANFKGDADTERKRINEWVEGQTNNRIKDLLPERSVDSDSRLVLTNAIFFKGSWAKEFNKKQTYKSDFMLADGKKVKTFIMNKSEKTFKFAHLSKEGKVVVQRFPGDGKPSKGEFKLVELPYKGEELSMVIILPSEADGLSALEKNLSSENLQSWLKQMKKQDIELAIPKFKLETKYNLASSIISLGMKDAFTPDADFTGMSDHPEAKRLRITGAFHKAFVQVDEKGTEAAAATGIVVGIESARIISSFRADHPFLFLIRDVETGNILFLGRVMNPKK